MIINQDMFNVFDVKFWIRSLNCAHSFAHRFNHTLHIISGPIDSPEESIKKRCSLTSYSRDVYLVTS